MYSCPLRPRQRMGAQMKLSHAAYKIYLALCDWYEQRHYPPTHDDLAGDTERSVVTRHIEKLEEIGWVKQDRTPAGRGLSRTPPGRYDCIHPAAGPYAPLPTQYGELRWLR